MLCCVVTCMSCVEELVKVTSELLKLNTAVDSTFE